MKKANNTKPGVLIVDNSRSITGALHAILHAATPLGHAYAFEFVLPTGSTARPALEEAGFRVHELPFVEISRRPKDLLLYVPMLLLNGWRLAQLVRRSRVAVLHLNDFYNLTGYVAQILSLSRLHVITHVRFLPHTQVQPLARTWRWMAERFARRVVCVSQAVREYFSGISKVQVVYDPLPGAETHPAMPHPQPRPDGTVRLLYLSNYIPGKGQDLAVAAFRAAHEVQPQLRLHFAGGDMGLEKNREFRRQLESTIQQAGLAEAVTFGGFVQDVEQAIKSADIVLNFSESESFSLTCLDALYYGTPLIAADCGGPRELFEHGRSGLLVPNRDVTAMAAAMVQLASDAPLRREFATAGRAFVRQKFRPEATYLRLGEMYRQVLAEA